MRRQSDTHGTSYSDGSGDWRNHAACRGLDTDLFFPNGHGVPAQRQAREALEICATCPVRAPCRQEADEHDERFGIWGGLTEEQRGWRKGKGDWRARTRQRVDA